MTDETPTPDTETPEIEEAPAEETAEAAPETDAAADAKREAANAKREATKLRKQLEALEAEREERRLAEMNEVERAEARATALEQELTAIRAEAERTAREGWIREAARDAKMDPDVAIALLYGREVGDSGEAAVEVQQLATEKPHLIVQEKGETPRVGIPTSPAPAADEDPETTLGNFLLGVIGRRK